MVTRPLQASALEGRPAAPARPWLEDVPSPSPGTTPQVRSSPPAVLPVCSSSSSRASTSHPASRRVLLPGSASRRLLGSQAWVGVAGANFRMRKSKSEPTKRPAHRGRWMPPVPSPQRGPGASSPEVPCARIAPPREAATAPAPIPAPCRPPIPLPVRPRPRSLQSRGPVPRSPPAQGSRSLQSRGPDPRRPAPPIPPAPSSSHSPSSARARAAAASAQSRAEPSSPPPLFTRAAPPAAT